MHDIERFMSKVEIVDSGCWEWQAWIQNTGYGLFWLDGKQVGAHRASLILRGVDVTGWFVCHKCDNRKCVNPSHLFLGTHLDNVRDMHAKGRAGSAPGSRHGQHKLTEASVLEIRARYAAGGVLQKDLCREYGVSKHVMSLVVNRKGWRHV